MSATGRLRPFIVGAKRQVATSRALDAHRGTPSLRGFFLRDAPPRVQKANDGFAFRGWKNGGQ